MECLTLVEVPFFTRSRPKRRRHLATGWAWVAIVFGLAVIVTVGTYLLARTRLRSERLLVFEQLVMSADRDEAAGDFEAALAALDQAVATASALNSVDPARLEGIQNAHQRLSEKLNLERREARIQSAESSLSEARSLLSTTPVKATRALELVTSVFQTARSLADPRAENLQRQAVSIASSLVQSRGLRFDPVEGPFLFDSRTARSEYARRVRPILLKSLSVREFLPDPEEGPLAFLWKNDAPYHLSISARESFGPNYLQSQNRMTRIECSLSLSIGDRMLWSTYLVAKTQVPSRAFSAFESGYIGTSPRREPEIESKLRGDAMGDLVNQLPGKLENLPEWQAVQ